MSPLEQLISAAALDDQFDLRISRDRDFWVAEYTTPVRTARTSALTMDDVLADLARMVTA
jgi:hypothetical protein